MPKLHTIRFFATTTTIILALFGNVALAAKYRVTFTGTWNASDVRSGFPSASAHFSPMIGVTHREGAQFWQNGGQASPGVEDVAELGVNGVLRRELTALAQAGNASSIIEFDSLFNLPNSDTLEIEVSDDMPFISLITMIAPSPDWFIGVSGLSLKDENGFVKNLRMDLRPYDAGTEEGVTFSLGNPASPSTEVISRLNESDSLFIGRPVIGSLQFTLIGEPEEPTDPQQPEGPRTDVKLVLPAVLDLLLNGNAP